MKRILAMALIIGIITTFFAACQLPDSTGTVAFYYLRGEDNFQYGTEDGVIAPEQREVSGRGGNLRYMLTLYLEGPLDPAYVSPFPEHTRILELNQEDGILSIVLSEEFGVLADLDLTLACACMAATGFGLCNAEEVQISVNSEQHGIKIITLNRDSLVLLDDTTATEGTS